MSIGAIAFTVVAIILALAWLWEVTHRDPDDHWWDGDV